MSAEGDCFQPREDLSITINTKDHPWRNLLRAYSSSPLFQSSLDLDWVDLSSPKLSLGVAKRFRCREGVFVRLLYHELRPVRVEISNASYIKQEVGLSRVSALKMPMRFSGARELA